MGYEELKIRAEECTRRGDLTELAAFINNNHLHPIQYFRATIVETAAAYGHVHIFRAICDAQSPIIFPKLNWNVHRLILAKRHTAIKIAASNGRTQLLEYFFELLSPNDLRRVLRPDYGPLNEAANCGHDETLRWLIRKRESVLASNKINAVYITLFRVQNFAMVRWLFRRGFDLDLAITSDRSAAVMHISHMHDTQVSDFDFLVRSSCAVARLIRNEYSNFLTWFSNEPELSARVLYICGDLHELHEEVHACEPYTNTYFCAEKQFQADIEKAFDALINDNQDAHVECQNLIQNDCLKAIRTCVRSADLCRVVYEFMYAPTSARLQPIFSTILREAI